MSFIDEPELDNKIPYINYSESSDFYKKKES